MGPCAPRVLTSELGQGRSVISAGRSARIDPFHSLLVRDHRPLLLAIHRRTNTVADTSIVIGRYIIAMKPVVAAAPMLRLASSDRPRVEKGLSLTR